MEQRMNYLAELNAFHDYLLLNQLSTSEIALWHALVHINNKTMWKTEFTASNLMLQQLTGLSLSGIASARNKLKQRGVLTYAPGKARQAGKYHLFHFSKDEYVQASAQSECRHERDNGVGVSETLIDINKNTNKEKISKKKHTEGFEEFWQMYPRKVAKANAQKAFEKLSPNPELLAEMLSALERQKQSDAWQQENGKYIPHPATWLNGRRWEDEETNGRSKRPGVIDERAYSPGELDAKIYDPIEEILRKQEAGAC